ncbi:hypothetical protein CKM354_000781500 [Cercospora kikuchii]|uniref:Aspartate/glutamate/uridylate kinase domain-containing protein n=1 Tax=Cercospora kikuchii TaxID=84275 RepID=A0A9P3CK04_9PEZI|nr:uncharacterized protein CKM354_000781500 [Cercospora kikuchii]GIZ44622.1 hypothetical protein CKM354_000781500 [Cercospora kikuchii]
MEKSDTIVIAISAYYQSSRAKKLTQHTTGVSEDTPLLSTLSRVAEAAHRLRSQGHRVIICTTGVVNIGVLDHRGSERCPDAISKDALAALGQGKLAALWGQLFSHLRQSTAHIPISKDDIKSTARLKKIRQMLKDLLMHEAIPIVSVLGRILPAINQSSEAGYVGCLVASMIGSTYIVVARTKRGDINQTELRTCLDLALMVTTAMGIGVGNFAAVYLDYLNHDAKKPIDYGCKLIIEDVGSLDKLPRTIERL